VNQTYTEFAVANMLCISQAEKTPNMTISVKGKLIQKAT